jgi:hypothetical protein
MAKNMDIKKRGESVSCCTPDRTINYMEQIYEQLIYLNEKMERFLQFIKYAAAGGFITTAVYFLLKIGKLF